MEMTGTEAFYVALLFVVVNSQPDTYHADNSFMLGCSLIECTDESTLQNSLGTSLVTFVEDSLQNLDGSVESCDEGTFLRLGSSLVIHDTESDSVLDDSGSSLELGLSLDVIEYQSDQEEYSAGPVTSTPTKDTIANNYYHIHAKPRPRKALNEYIASEMTNGSGMKKKALDLSSIQKCKRNECKCGRECKKQMTMRDIFHVRELYWSKSKHERFSWMISVIKDAEWYGKYKILYLTREVSVCTEAFIDILRISRGTYFRAVKLNKENRMTVHLNEPRKISKQTIEAIVWFQEYSQFYGDRMPHKEDVLLPYKSRKQDIYHSYKIEHKDFVSRSQFFRIWSQHFPHVKIKKTNSFSRCSTCTSLERECEKTTDVKIRSHYKQLKGEHVDRQMLERAHYHGKRLSSEKEPTKYLSFIVDGMDQGKTSLPHFAGRPSKTINQADLLKTHVSGIVNHGQGKFSTYVDFNQYPHDPNLTINLILKTLKKVAEEQGNRLPEILYLQADNCFRENKNRFVLGFLELLVSEQIFKEVYMSFLPVGHTHEDVDAAFSKISEKLKVKDVETIPQLVSIIPDSEELDNMFDVKTWLEPCFNVISQISKPLHYKFYNYDGTTRTCYKGINTEPWQTLDFNLLAVYPKGQPDKLVPNFDKINIDRVKRQVCAIRSYFGDSSSYDWWMEFLNSLEREPLLKRYTWILKDLPRQTHQVESTEIVDVPAHIEEMLQKERDRPKLIVKAKKKQTRPNQKNSGTGTSKNSGTGTSKNSGTGTSKNSRTGTSKNSGTGTSKNSGAGTSKNSGTGTSKNSGAGTSKNSRTGKAKGKSKTSGARESTKEGNKKSDCGDPKPVNGNINTTSTVPTTDATIWCNDGYTLIGDSVITCQSNEAWTSYPTCELTDCGNPVPLKGSANSSETTYKTALEITCDVGYILAGLSTITCQANGTWTDSPVCDKAANTEVMSDSGNTADTSNVGLFIGVGVGASAATLLAVGIVIIIRRHLRHEQVRRRTPENTHELTDVQQRNIRIEQESPNIRIVQESPNIPTLAEY